MRTCKRQAHWAPPSTLNRRRWASPWISDVGKEHAWRGEDGGDEEVGIGQLFTLTDSLMTRWCCVCQQSCRLRMNGCLTCRCQKGTHARTHAYRHTDTHWQWMKRDGQANLVPCYRMRLLHQDSTYKLYLTTITTCSTTCLQYRVLQNICSPRQMCRWTGQILMHKFQSFSFAFKWQHFFFLLLSSIHLHEVYNTSSSLIWMFSTDFGITFDLQKLEMCTSTLYFHHSAADSGAL